MKRKNQIVRLILAWTLFLLVLAGCNLPNSAKAVDPGMQQTQVALGIQATMLAEQQAAIDAEAAQPAPAEPAQPAQPVEQPTYTPYPTYTVAAPAAPTAAPPTVAPPTAEPPPVVDVAAQVKAANILVFEDMQGYGAPTYVRDTINRMGFRGGKIVFVGDAVGTFMEHLNSPQPWDLIIVAAESRNAVRGEFWDVLSERINGRDAALVAEVWYLDSTANGRIAPLLHQCGIEFQRDWTRNNANFNPFDYSIYWLDSAHPLLSSPNYAEPLSYPTEFWSGDVGDLIRLGSSGDAQLVGGLHMREKSSYGVLATCMDGTVVFQTFCSHDYPQTKVMSLWENYITYTLTNHFEQLNAQ